MMPKIKTEWLVLLMDPSDLHSPPSPCGLQPTPHHPHRLPSRPIAFTCTYNFPRFA